MAFGWTFVGGDMLVTESREREAAQAMALPCKHASATLPSIESHGFHGG